MDDATKVNDLNNIDQNVSEDNQEMSDDAMQKLIEQNADLTNKWKRAVADYANLEKQVRKEKSEFMQFASASMVMRFLPILDNLEQAVQGMSDEEKKSGWAVGVLMTVKQFKDLMKEEGLSEIKALNEEFDAHKMEAIDTVEGEKNKVVQVVKSGYMMQDRVLRPAQVLIGKGEV
jgi:molecular chaperone GrpE